MARPKADYPPAAEILAMTDEEGRLAVRVIPGARSEGIAVVDGRVSVKVRAKPKNGEANEAVLAALAAALDLAPSQVTMLRGATSRDKLVRIEA